MERLVLEGRATATDRANGDAVAVARTLELHRLMFDAASPQEPSPPLLALNFVMKHGTSSITDHDYRGPCGWRDWIDDLFEEFSGRPRLSVEAILAAEQTFVVATYSLTGTSVHTGTTIEFRWSAVTWFEQGRATRSIGCTSAEEALAIAARPGRGGTPERAPQSEAIIPEAGPPRVRIDAPRRRRPGLAPRVLAGLLGAPSAGSAARPAWL